MWSGGFSGEFDVDGRRRTVAERQPGPGRAALIDFMIQSCGGSAPTGVDPAPTGSEGCEVFGTPSADPVGSRVVAGIAANALLLPEHFE